MKSAARTTYSQLTRAIRRLRPPRRARPALTFRCPQPWEDMTPVDEAAGIRHCGRCRQNVYDLVGRSEAEIIAAIEASDGDLCGQVTVRQDGRVAAGGCKEGTRQIRRGRIALK